MNLRISLLISARKSSWDFESLEQFGDYCHFNNIKSQHPSSDRFIEYLHLSFVKERQSANLQFSFHRNSGCNTEKEIKASTGWSKQIVLQYLKRNLERWFDNFQPFNHLHQFWFYFTLLFSFHPCQYRALCYRKAVYHGHALAIRSGWQYRIVGTLVGQLWRWRCDCLFCFILQTSWCLLLICYRSMFVALRRKLLSLKTHSPGHKCADCQSEVEGSRGSKKVSCFHNCAWMSWSSCCWHGSEGETTRSSCTSEKQERHAGGVNLVYLAEASY